MFRNARVNARGGTGVHEWCPDIEVGKSAVSGGYRWAHLSGLVRRGYLLSQEVSRHRGFGAFAIPSCFGVGSFRLSKSCLGEFRAVFVFDSFRGCVFPFVSLGSLRRSCLCVQILCECNFP